MSGNAPVVAFFCATYLKPEMHHIHRQIGAVDGWQPLVLTQKVENRETFPVDMLEVVPRSPWRFAARAVERNFTHAPWQISRSEAKRMRDVLRAREARVLHVFFGNVAVHLLPLLESVRIPTIVSFHGADVAGSIASPEYRAARERVFALACKVVCRSEALVTGVERLGCPPEKLTVIRTTLPTLNFHERVIPESGAIHLVQACRLVAKKGLPTSLAAFAKLATRYPKMTLTIAGTGPLEEELRERARELGVADRVRFTGFLDQTRLRDLFASAHIFLHPSETVSGDVEGIPNGLLEAMAMGLPAVTTRHGGIPEVVDHEISGLLCAERDADGVAMAMERLILDPEMYARIARDGSVSVRQKFSREAVGATLNDLYSAAGAGKET